MNNDVQWRIGDNGGWVYICTNKKREEQRVWRISGGYKPFIKYELFDRVSERTFQSKTTGTRRVIVSESYISSIAKEVEELQGLELVETMSRDWEIIIGDFNTRHKFWDEKVNSRGQRIGRWTKHDHYNIKSPVCPTFVQKKERLVPMTYH